MATNTFKVSVNHDDSSRYGFMLSSDSSQHQHASAITRQVLIAMRTNKAFLALKHIAKNWAEQYHPQMDIVRAVRDFQMRLADAAQNNSLWPTIILHWTNHDIAAAFLRDTPKSEHATEFKMSNHYFRLNGHRLYLYSYDVQHQRKEKYVRWFEIFASYLHEIGHMFVTFLSLTYKQNLRASTPTLTKMEYMDHEKPEAGWVLEDCIFGGVYHRCHDNSGRAWEFMTGVPTMDTAEGQLGVSLDRLLNLARKQGPYADDDFDLQLYQPMSGSQNESWSRFEYHEFFDCWKGVFNGEVFADPNAPVPDCDQEQIPQSIEDRTTNERAKFDFGFSVRNARVTCKRVVLIWEDHRAWKVSQGSRKKHKNRKLSRSEMEKVLLLIKSYKAELRSRGGRKGTTIPERGDRLMPGPIGCHQGVRDHASHPSTEAKRGEVRKHGDDRRSTKTKETSKSWNEKPQARVKVVQGNRNDERKKDDQRKPPTKRIDSLHSKTPARSKCGSTALTPSSARF